VPPNQQVKGQLRQAIDARTDQENHEVAIDLRAHTAVDRLHDRAS
jgi:O-methyltransferase involved in polyketide biosynthesis